MAYDLAIQDNWGWKVNERPASASVADYLNDTVLNEFAHHDCLYCGTQMTVRHFSENPDGDSRDRLYRSYTLSTCSRCAHWDFEGNENNCHCLDPPMVLAAASIVRRFDSAIPDGCTKEVAQYLRRHPLAWNSMSPTRLEHLVADIIRINYGPCEVRHVGGPGDLGIDVIFVDCGTKTWLVQVKRRSKPESAEGFSTLQSLLGTLALKGERYGMVVSTADHFSYQARKQCGEAKQRGFIVELVDKGLLDRMLGPCLPYRPWISVLRHPSLNALDESVFQHLISGLPNPNQYELF